MARKGKEANQKPKWVEVRDELEERIESGDWAAGDKILPEPALASSLGVSRATLRDALRALEEDGYLSRTPGAGTYITRRSKLANNLNINFGVSDMIRSMGAEPGTTGLALYETEASEDDAATLNLEAGAPLVVVERVRTADGRPVVFSRDFYPLAVLERGIEVHERISGESLYEFLERRLGILVQHGVATIAPTKADDEIAEKLEVEPGELLLYLRQADYDGEGTPVLLSKEYHLADAFEFNVVRRGARPNTPDKPRAGQRSAS